MSCGGGSQNRSRDCYGPFHGGTECPGSKDDWQDCNTQSCPGMYTSLSVVALFCFVYDAANSPILSNHG